MIEKWIGAALVIGSCGVTGFSMVAAHKKEENALRQLIRALDFMECELQYRLTPLPELCRQAGAEAGGTLGQALRLLSRELECQILPDVESCMNAALSACGDLPERTGKAMRRLGASLGRFDLEGQLKGLESVRSDCREELKQLGLHRDERLRSYQTLGLCAGAALTILFI